MIKLKSINQIYNGKNALSDVSLEMKPGNFYALLGHNGAGKSTLLNVIAGQEFPTSGYGEVLGYELGMDLGVDKAHIGYISEKVNFNLPVPLFKFFESYSTFYKSWDHFLFKKLIDQQNLDLTKEFSEFSRGQKMQIVLIATLARSPKILLIDEITSVLDVNARSFFINYLKEFAEKGGIVVMTTNIIHEVNQQATNAIILQGGKIIINSGLNELENQFIKLRKTNENKDNEIFNDENCVWIGKNTDNSDTYMVDSNTTEIESINFLKDKRKLTLSEVFMYFNEKEKTQKKAA